MPELKKIFVCSKCDSQFLKWQGQCSECNNWGTLEEKIAAKKKEEEKEISSSLIPLKLEEISQKPFFRIKTEISEFDRVMGNGIVPGSLILIGGDPGIGKSTLVLQIASQIAKTKSVLYISGEESLEQIKLRAERLEIKKQNSSSVSENLSFLSETNLNQIIATIKEKKPNLAIIDSIQTIYQEEISIIPGSISQVKISASQLATLAKTLNIPIIIVGHVTKEGDVAGPKTLEHLVDVVLYLEGERFQTLRILRGSKNRFGSTFETGVFEMQEKGLFEVLNPSSVFLKEKKETLAGESISVTSQGSRFFLLEIQGLCSRTTFGYPRRTVSGFDWNRLQLLIAVLTQKTKINLINQDVYLNIVGGLKIEESALDLTICLALASAYLKKPCPSQFISLGEVALSGELRNVPFLEKRILQAKKLGFKNFLVPSRENISLKDVKILKAKTIDEAIKIVFSQN